MLRDGFEIEISQVSTRGKIFFFLTLLIVLMINIGIIVNEKDSKTYALSYVGVLENKPVITVYKENDDILVTKEEIDSQDILISYECKTNTCAIYDLNKDLGKVIVLDDEVVMLDYINNVPTILNIEVNDITNIKFINNNLYIVKNNKYALFNIETNSLITDFIYDGLNNKQFNNLTNSIFSLYTNNSKYNQTLDVFDNSFNIIKHYDHCSSFNDNETGYCSEHIEGFKTNQEVDEVIDIVLSQYPDLNSTRLFTIKTAIETFGLPYFWGGGHTSLENTLYTATQTWNTKYCTVYGNGFKNQKGGYSYPCGLDCSGFVRWVYYVGSGVDTFKEGVNVIGGRNPNLVKIEEKDLLPGDLIMDKDHVVIYLYKNDEGKHISVHASYDHLKVEISNYKKGDQFYRLGIWS